MRAVIDAAREQRFRELATLVAEPVRRYLARRSDAATADEMLNDALLVCWRRLDEVPGEPSESIPWAIGVARNLLANAQRAQRRRDRLTAKIIALDPPPLSAPVDENGGAGSPGRPRPRAAAARRRRGAAS